jgi:hypothetical protein
MVCRNSLRIAAKPKPGDAAEQHGADFVSY